MEVSRRKRLLSLLENAEAILQDDYDEKSDRMANNACPGKIPIQIEIRSLEFWRAIIGECIGTFFYVMLLSSTHQALNYPKDSIAMVQLMSAVTAGLAITTLTHAFIQVSGAHFNPALSIAAVLMKRITILRGAAYICAHCGGAIAGAALVYGVYGRTGAKDQFGETSIANFGMEFILSFLVAYVFFSVTPATNASGRRSADHQPQFSTSLSIGLAYLTALSAYRGSLNPARALGPAFVADGWSYHWVFWAGPILGACCGAFCYTFIFNLKKPKWAVDGTNGGNLDRGGGNRRTIVGKDLEIGSMKSEEDMIDDLERVRQYKSNMIATYNDGLTGLDSVYNTSVKPYKSRQQQQQQQMLTAESVYGGTKSLYNGGGQMYGEQDTRGMMGRRTPGLDTKSMYGGLDDARSTVSQSRAQLKRSLSVHSKIQRRNPQDNLPEEPPVVVPLGDCVSNMAAINRSRQQQQQQNAMQLSEVSASYARKYSSSNTNDQFNGGSAATQESMYREYIKQKNAEADAASSPMEQLSAGSSSGGQCSAGSGGSSSGYYSTSARDEHAQNQRASAMKDQQQQFHRRERSMCSTRGEAYRRGAAIEAIVPPPPPPAVPAGVMAIGEGGGLRGAQNFTPSSASSFGY
eukprot:TRINITY_DN4395_c0_g1_i1.p1 TRINITY_DN4395_c0_g1~~TRINITY_DN4395_c0_g1_i1.p1  ORF type:complete len:633 (-),score=133.34 TRINITY_DN4395_c0_g1_i1:461-2359(-)